MRAVTRTIPAALERIPVQMAAEVGASRRPRVQRATLVTVGGDFGKTLTHNGAVPGLQMVERGQLARRQILGKILYDRCILTQEIADCRECLARRIIDIGPLRLFEGSMPS